MNSKDEKQVKKYRKDYYIANRDKIRTRAKAWFADNSERAKKRRKAYYDANPDKAKRDAKVWRDANLEQEKAMCKAWRDVNKEYIKATNRAYHKANPEKIKANKRVSGHKRRALKYKTQVEFINEKIVFMRDGWICQHCKKRVNRKLRWPDPLSPSLDHIMPLSKGGAHIYSNVQLAHFVCNVSKNVNVLSQGEQMRIF